MVFAVVELWQGDVAHDAKLLGFLRKRKTLRDAVNANCGVWKFKSSRNVHRSTSDRTLEFSVDQLLDQHALAMRFAACPLVIQH